MTVPLSLLEGFRSISPTLNPASVMIFFASSSVFPTTFGTLPSSGPLLRCTTISCEPLIVSPASGSCFAILPFSTSLSYTSSPSFNVYLVFFIASFASSIVLPLRSGILFSELENPPETANIIAASRATAAIPAIMYFFLLFFLLFFFKGPSSLFRTAPSFIGFSRF